MDLRNLQDQLSPGERCEARRRQIEKELELDLSDLSIDPTKLGHAEEHGERVRGIEGTPPRNAEKG